MTISRLCALLALAMTLACTPTTQETTDAPDMGSAPDIPAGTPTYHADVRPLITTYCTRCHSDNGIGPLTFEYQEQDFAGGAPWWGPLVAMEVASGRMPPWKPADGCREISPNWNMPTEAREIVAAWATAGFPEGDPAAYVAPEVETAPEMPAPDLSIAAAEAYAPPRDQFDDHHCLILDHDFDVDTFVQGVNVEPDKERIVHHALVFNVPPEFTDQIAALDEADPGPGYTCYGGPGVDARQLLKVWLPGGRPTLFPEDSAIAIPAGSKIVLQMHYNTLSLGPEEPSPADASRVTMWTTPDNQPPERQVIIAGSAHTGIEIAPGDANSTHQRDFRLQSDATIIGVIPHMHSLGASIKAKIRHQDGSESCVIDVPTWDFDWQDTHLFPQDQWIEIKRGDVHDLFCSYDNSPGNQPIVEGQQISPRLVTWGDDTLDEMCLNYLIATVPYDAQGGTTLGCSTFPDCVRACPEGDGACFARCASGAGNGCDACLLEGSAACGRAECDASLSPVLSCLRDCTGSTGTCLVGECRGVMDTLTTCLKPKLEAGTCNAAFEGCGVSF